MASTCTPKGEVDNKGKEEEQAAADQTRVERLDFLIQHYAAEINERLLMDTGAGDTDVGGGRGGGAAPQSRPTSSPDLLRTEMWLGELRQEREIILEERRVANVVGKFREEVVTNNSPQAEEDCPVCFESIELVNDNSPRLRNFCFLPCCFNAMCCPCYDALGQSTPECPFCRESLLPEKLTWENELQWAKIAAERGNAAAHYNLFRLTKGMASYDAHRPQWLFGAALQGHGPAMYDLAMAYDRGEVPGIEQSKGEARRWFKDAAYAGNSKGQSRYSREPIKSEEKIRFMTLVVAKEGYTDPCFVSVLDTIAIHKVDLGFAHHCGKYSVSKSLERGKYWYERRLGQSEKLVSSTAARNSKARAQHLLGQVLFELARSRYAKHGCPCYAGDNSIARALQLEREAVSANCHEKEKYSKAHDEMEQFVSRYCANCYANKRDTTEENHAKKKGMLLLTKKDHTDGDNDDDGGKVKTDGEMEDGGGGGCEGKVEKDPKKKSKKKTEKLLCCDRCKSAYYCSKACQIAHWKLSHELVCRKGGGLRT